MKFQYRLMAYTHCTGQGLETMSFSIMHLLRMLHRGRDSDRKHCWLLCQSRSLSQSRSRAVWVSHESAVAKTFQNWLLSIFSTSRKNDYTEFLPFENEVNVEICHFQIYPTASAGLCKLKIREEHQTFVHCVLTLYFIPHTDLNLHPLKTQHWSCVGVTRAKALHRK